MADMRYDGGKQVRGLNALSVVEMHRADLSDTPAVQTLPSQILSFLSSPHRHVVLEGSLCIFAILTQKEY